MYSTRGLRINRLLLKIPDTFPQQIMTTINKYHQTVSPNILA